MTRLYKELYKIFGIAILTGIAAFSASAALNFDLVNLRNQNEIFTKAYDIIKTQETWEKIQNPGQSVPLSSIRIGIIDVDGVDVNHQEFSGEAINSSRVGKVDFGNTPVSARIDEGGHGTAVAGIIGANNISFFKTLESNSPQMSGVVGGVSPNLNYTLEARKTGSAALLFDRLKALFQSKLSGTDIINISLGGVKRSALTKEQQDSGFIEGQVNSVDFFIHTQIWKLMFNSAPDTLFVVSAGNHGINTDNATPANLGDLANVVTVSATNLDDERAKFNPFQESNFGGGVSVSAPGKNVYAPKPGNQYDPNFSGTSASAPLVTGVAGLLKAISPNLTPAQIKQILVETGDHIFTDPPIGPRLNALKAVCELLTFGVSSSCADFAFDLDGFRVDGNILGSGNRNGTPDFLDTFDDGSLTAPPTSFFFFTQGQDATQESGGFLRFTNQDGATIFEQPHNTMILDDASLSHLFQRGAGNFSLAASFVAKPLAPHEFIDLGLVEASANPVREAAAVILFGSSQGTFIAFGGNQGTVAVQPIDLRNVSRIVLVLLVNDAARTVTPFYSLDGGVTFIPFSSQSLPIFTSSPSFFTFAQGGVNVPKRSTPSLSSFSSSGYTEERGEEWEVSNEILRSLPLPQMSP